jgi:tRNA pseudouridine65 synthase
LVFALTSEVARAVQECFQAFEVRKVYWALVRGVPPSSGEIDHPIPRSEGGLRVPAQTSFRCLGTTGQFSLVEASPKTGRLHQIRRHFKHISHPLVGDVRYGKGSINRMFRTEFGLQRLALHAKQIEFPHPSSGQCLRVVSSLPKDLLDALEGLGITVPFGGCENATAVGPSFSSLDPS